MFLKLENVHKVYDQIPILKGVNTTLSDNYKYGLIGKNGSGKTTLLKIIAGLEQPTKGKVRFSKKNLKVLYLHQTFDDLLFENPEYANYTLLDFLFLQSTDIFDLYRQIFVENKNSLELITSFDDHGGFLYQANFEKILKNLDLNFNLKIKYLSQGQRTRLQLAKIYALNPDILLLDEPTNNLDFDGVKLIYEFINDFSGLLIISSHDRNLLNFCVNKIILIEDLTLKEYSGNYSQYQKIKLDENIKKERILKANKIKISKLNMAAQNLERRIKKHEIKKEKLKLALSTLTKLDKKNKFSKRNLILSKIKIYKDNDKLNSKYKIERQSKKIKKTRSNILDRSQKLISKLPEKEIEWGLKIDFQTSEVKSNFIFIAKNLAIGYDDKILISNFNIELKYGDKIAIIGRNGVGKSSLLKTIAGFLPLKGGQLIFGNDVKIGYLEQSNYTLNYENTVINEFKSVACDMDISEMISFLHFLFFDEDLIYRQIKTLSEGEKVKLKIAKLLYSKSNLLLLDEPTNFLDITSKEVIEKALIDYMGAMIVVTHDTVLINNLKPKHIIELN